MSQTFVKCVTLRYLSNVSDIYQIFPIPHLRPDLQACFLKLFPGEGYKDKPKFCCSYWGQRWLHLCNLCKPGIRLRQQSSPVLTLNITNVYIQSLYYHSVGAWLKLNISLFIAAWFGAGTLCGLL